MLKPMPAPGLDERIRLLLKAHSDKDGMKQADLATAIGITRQALNDIVHGRKSGHKHVDKIAVFFKVDYTWLWNGGVMPPAIRAVACDDGGLERDRRYYEEVMRVAQLRWIEALSVNQNKAEDLLPGIDEYFRNRIGNGAILKTPWTIDETLELLKPWNMPEETMMASFRRGFFFIRALQAATIHGNKSATCLSDVAFDATIKSLRATRSLLQSYSCDLYAVDLSLLELWQMWAFSRADIGISTHRIQEMIADIGPAANDILAILASMHERDPIPNESSLKTKDGCAVVRTDSESNLNVGDPPP